MSPDTDYGVQTVRSTEYSVRGLRSTEYLWGEIKITTRSKVLASQQISKEAGVGANSLSGQPTILRLATMESGP